jgi:hypothetical protein
VEQIPPVLLAGSPNGYPIVTPLAQMPTTRNCSATLSFISTGPTFQDPVASTSISSKQTLPFPLERIGIQHPGRI